MYALARSLALGRGKVDDAVVDRASAAGLDETLILDVVLECALASLVGGFWRLWSVKLPRHPRHPRHPEGWASVRDHDVTSSARRRLAAAGPLSGQIRCRKW